MNFTKKGSRMQFLFVREALQNSCETRGVNANLGHLFKSFGKLPLPSWDSCIQTLKNWLTPWVLFFRQLCPEALGELQTKYDITEKKENTIIQQKVWLGRKNYFIYGIAGLLAATVLFGCIPA